jgi:hypothetical protein
MIFHRKSGSAKNSGIMLTVQKSGIKAAKTIISFVIKEISVSSSQLSFLKVVKRHAKEAKLNIEITGVMIGKTNIKRI